VLLLHRTRLIPLLRRQSRTPRPLTAAGAAIGRCRGLPRGGRGFRPVLGAAGAEFRPCGRTQVTSASSMAVRAPCAGFRVSNPASSQSGRNMVRDQPPRRTPDQHAGDRPADGRCAGRGINRASSDARNRPASRVGHPSTASGFPLGRPRLTPRFHVAGAGDFNHGPHGFSRSPRLPLVMPCAPSARRRRAPRVVIRSGPGLLRAGPSPARIPVAPAGSPKQDRAFGGASLTSGARSNPHPPPARGGSKFAPRLGAGGRWLSGLRTPLFPHQPTVSANRPVRPTLP